MELTQAKHKVWATEAAIKNLKTFDPVIAMIGKVPSEEIALLRKEYKQIIIDLEATKTMWERSLKDDSEEIW